MEERVAGASVYLRHGTQRILLDELAQFSGVVQNINCDRLNIASECVNKRRIRHSVYIAESDGGVGTQTDLQHFNCQIRVGYSAAYERGICAEVFSESLMGTGNRACRFTGGDRAGFDASCAYNKSGVNSLDTHEKIAGQSRNEAL